MGHQQQLADKWTEMRAKLRHKWHQLTDEDVRSFNGNVEQLVARIERKTGESREAIKRFVDSLSEEGEGMVDELRDRVQAGAAQVQAAAQQGYDAVCEGYSEAEQMVKNRPGQSMAVAFGVGLVVGMGAVFLLRERVHEMPTRRERGMTERLGRQMLDTLASMMPKH